MPEAKKRNVLFVLSDQHQAACAGYEGHPQALTPNMDRLAAAGVRFTRAYTQNPICTPSRVSILSGQYCHNHGYYGLSGPTPLALPDFLTHFRQHGYRTAGIGKMHLPNDPKVWPSDGMTLYADCYYKPAGVEDGDSPYFQYLKKLGLADKEDSVGLPEFPGRQQHEGRPSNLPYEHSVEGWCVKQAIDFIDAGGDQPFCMEVSLPRPHQCYTPDKMFWDMYDDDLALPPTIRNDASHRPPHFRNAVEGYRKSEGLLEPKGFEHVSRRVWRAYLACITQVDHALGQLIDHLETRGLAENTIIIYGSDHGAYSTTHGVPEKAPGICSEAVCRVPYIWHVPGHTKAGHVSDAFVENIDLAPTICNLCDLPPIDSVDGRNISHLLAGDTTPVRDMAVTEHPWSKAIRWDKWRFVHYQYAMFDGDDVGELYDLEADPDETRNLYHDPAYAHVVHEARRRLLEWLIGTTRIATMWPSPGWSREAGIRYPTAGDGKESNTAGPAQRARNGAKHYL